MCQGSSASGLDICGPGTRRRSGSGFQRGEHVLGFACEDPLEARAPFIDKPERQAVAARCTAERYREDLALDPSPRPGASPRLRSAGNEDR